MNMSSGGVLFTSNVELEIGSPIEYFITLQKSRNGAHKIRLHCVGKVVRRHDGATMRAKDNVIAIAATLERHQFVRPD
jgi:hypothetical protein